MTQMQGMPAAPGCAVGQVLLFPKGPISISKQAVDEPKLEIKQLDFARNACLKFLERLLGQKQRDEDVVGILEAYLEILHDDVFFSKIKKTIRDEFVCAPWAIEQARPMLQPPLPHWMMIISANGWRISTIFVIVSSRIFYLAPNVLHFHKGNW